MTEVQTTASATLAAKFQTAIAEFDAGMIDRREEIDLVMIALLCNEHVLLVGPPGTGKSMLSDAVVDWIDGDKFSLLLNKFTTPEEVYGPVSVNGLKQDQYRRITKGMLPEANVAFLDEIFKSSSAILNTMLKVLNERVYQNGDKTVSCPLRLCIGASNEWPEDKGLTALFDRFLFRKSVRALGTVKAIDRLLWSRSLSVATSGTLTQLELEDAQNEVSAMPWSADAKGKFLDIRNEARSNGIIPGDRRLRKAVLACQAKAWLAGELEVVAENLEVLAHCLWVDPADQPAQLQRLVSEIANPAGAAVSKLLAESEEVFTVAMDKNANQSVVASANSKLKEIHDQLKLLKGQRATDATTHVAANIRSLREAFLKIG